MSDAGDEAAADSGGWGEPPWTGFIETTGDALLILEAARQGIIPRVTRRLVEAERKMIGSGAVFVFDEEESGIKRWTDGLFWSPSRILGNFLLYREIEKKANVRGRGKQNGAAQPPSPPPPPMNTQPKADTSAAAVDAHGRALVGSLTDAQKFKNEGLMKKAFSLHIGGVAQHLISYYRPADVESGKLKTPSSHPEISQLTISPEYLDKTHFRVPPRVEVGEDGVARYLGESEELDLSNKPAPSTSSSSTPTPTTKKERRYNPVDKSKRPIKPKKEEPADEKPYPSAFYMQPLYGSYSYQPYYVGGGPGADPAAAAAWQQYTPYRIAYAPTSKEEGAGEEKADDGDGADADADADGDDDPEAAQES